MTIEQICLGHIVPINERCKTCYCDEYNVNCSDYHNAQITRFRVDENLEEYSDEVNKSKLEDDAID